MEDYPPFVVLVDIDGTIIGEIDAQLTEYQLLIQGPSKKKTKLNAMTTRGKMFKDQLVAHLMNGLMRPGFSAFCAQCHIMGIPVMLYTASEHEWANFLAPRIQQAVRLEMQRDLENAPKNFKFARLFTRKFCDMSPDGTCKKSLGRVGKDMYATLKKDYTMSRGIKALMDRTVLIDNTSNILVEKRNLVLVPTYNFAFFYDVTMNIDHTDTRRMQRARTLLSSEGSFVGEKVSRTASTTTLSFRAWLYNAIAQKMKEHSKEHEYARHNDTMWRTLRNRLVSFFRESNVHSGQSLAKHLAGHGSTSSTNSTTGTSGSFTTGASNRATVGTTGRHTKQA